jgi:CheY-like chemotaxis protein
MIEEFIQQIKEYINTNETGRLEIKNLKQQDQCWSLYFTLGRLIGAGSREHAQRRVYRQLKNHCPDLVQQPLQLQDEFNWQSSSFEYDLICQLFQESKIDINQLSAIQNDMVGEVLFDIFQVFCLQNQQGSEYSDNSGLQWQWFPRFRPEKYTPIPHEKDIASEELLNLAQQKWQKWQQAGLKLCSPNQAPLMQDAESIKQTTAAKTFENLQRLLTGKQTLREIAVETKRDILPVTQALWGYYKKGWLSFQNIPDLDLSKFIKQPSASKVATAASSSNNHRENNQKKFVVACVDDSPQVTQTVEEILRGNDYDFIGINDPLRASATLLKSKPDLIFLDLIMPNTNGYEICSQLRRVSSLKEVPIIILTGKDGLIDRMRAKMVGSTEYVSKPVQRKKILEMVQKYLPLGDEIKPEKSPRFYSAEAS